MKKIFWYILPFASAAVFLAVLYLANLGPSKQSEAATHDVTLTTTVITYLTFDITAGDTVPFGNLTPGTPIKAPAASTIASVTTNAANGYTLGLSDAHAASSSMAHTDTTTHITKMTNGTIGTPVAWGSNTGVGATMWTADTTPEAKWCTPAQTCTSYDDADNLYAAVPETATTAHTVTGFHASADTSSWAFEINVPNTQKTGAYSGTITYTATAVLS